MAIFHASTKPVSRGAGRSATAAAAYRSGSRVVDRRTGEIHDYTRKGGVVAAEIVLPDGTRATHLREQLWNAAEEAEKRKDGRVAREWVVALPDELNKEQRVALAAKFAMKLAATYGVAADLAVHEPSKKGDDRNHHAHILLTTRQAKLTGEGFELGDKATIELSDKARKAKGMKAGAEEIKELRKAWESLANQALEQAGQEARIDSRSHLERGINELPSTHLGPQATAIKREGKPLKIEQRIAERWAKAQEQARDELDAARAALAKLEIEVAELEAAEAPQTPLRAREAAMQAEILAEFQKRAEAQQKPVAAPVQETQQEPWQRLSRQELEDEIKFREGKLAKGIDYYVDADRKVQDTRKQLEELQAKAKQAQELGDKAERAQERWRDAHPYKAKLHDTGLLKNADLAEWEELQANAEATLERLAPRLKATRSAYEQARSVARTNVQNGAVEVKAELSELREILENKVSQERKEELRRAQEQAKARAPDFAKALEKYTTGAEKSKGSDYGLGR